MDGDCRIGSGSAVACRDKQSLTFIEAERQVIDALPLDNARRANDRIGRGVLGQQSLGAAAALRNLPLDRMNDECLFGVGSCLTPLTQNS